MEPGGAFRPEDRVGITEQGRYDLIFAQDCQCDPHLTGLLVTCTTCGTIYGHLSELDPQRNKRRRRQGW